MPELPEVETTRAGLAPHVKDQAIVQVAVHNARLRWPIAADLAKALTGQKITQLTRRAKYLLFHTQRGYLIIHLGMSGQLRLMAKESALAKHDHVEFILSSGQILRLNDSRRFGSVFYFEHPPEQFWLLKHLGPEPLTDSLTGAYLYQKAQGRRLAVKNFIMDNKIVVGVGNIYANEALFRAGIDPRRAANNISQARYQRLAQAIQDILAQAIQAGGTTLKDYVDARGHTGWFQFKLHVYDRAGQPCPRDRTPIKHMVLGQRSTYFCPHCQH